MARSAASKDRSAAVAGQPGPQSYNDLSQLGQYIPLHYHYQMLLDNSRIDGFKAAIQQVVPKDGVVLELGGGTGVLSFFAAAAARKVYCVEANPQMVAVSKELLKLNGVEDKVQVIQADASAYCPPEPVDVVICEMLHSAMLREKQLSVIEGFKNCYNAKFPDKLPTFIPEATFLAFQPVFQDFTFSGYKAPIPVFFEPWNKETGTTTLSDPVLYSMFEYRSALPRSFEYNNSFKLAQPGLLNALRFVTKNVLSINLKTNSTTDWHNFYMVLPLRSPVETIMGDRVNVSFSYEAGGRIEDLMDSLSVEVLR